MKTQLDEQHPYVNLRDSTKVNKMAAEPVKAAWQLLVNPSRIIACFAFIFVVRSADVDAKRADIAVPGVEPSAMNELLDNLIAASVAAGSQTEPELPDVLSHITDSTSTSVSNQHVTPEVVGMMEDKERNWPEDNFITLPVLVPTSPKVQEACRKHSRIFIHQLKRYKLWALQMFDSSAKIPSGILKGNVNQYGEFDQCLDVSAGEIKGQYCLVALDLQATSSASNNVESLYDPLEMALSHRFIRSTFRDPGHFIPRFTTINWAVCVPSSCSAVDIQEAFEDALAPYNVTYGINASVHVDPQMCYVKEEETKGFSKAALWTLSFFAVTALSAIVATLRDSMHTTSNHIPGRAERLLLAFSLKRNMKMLLADLPTEGDINCIYGVRAICTIALYLAHKVIALALMPYSNRITLTEVANAAWSTIFRASLIYTDSFLLLSGTLTSFNLSREMERKGCIQWASRIIARFIRLTPALVAVLLFYAYVMEHLGLGPLWNLSVKRNADICKEMFWRNMLYIQNLFPFEEMCATHTHQLALDMQLSLLSPLLVWLLWQWRLCALAAMLAIAATSAILRYLATLQHDLSLVIFHGITVSQLYKTANLTYAHSLHRATPYLVGVALGYLLYKTGKHFHIPKVAVCGGWLLAAGLASISLVSPAHLAFRDYHYDVQEASLYAVISPIAWSLALSWLIWACFTGNGGPVNTFLCLRGLVLFSRISYAVYLTQFAVFFYNVGSMRTSVPFSLSTSVDMVELVTIILVSIVVTLLFDLPMQEVKGILMGGGPRQRREKVE